MAKSILKFTVWHICSQYLGSNILSYIVLIQHEAETLDAYKMTCNAASCERQGWNMCEMALNGTGNNTDRDKCSIL